MLQHAARRITHYALPRYALRTTHYTRIFFGELMPVEFVVPSSCWDVTHMSALTLVQPETPES